MACGALTHAVRRGKRLELRSFPELGASPRSVVALFGFDSETGGSNFTRIMGKYVRDEHVMPLEGSR
jgi:hypothetical protein